MTMATSMIVNVRILLRVLRRLTLRWRDIKGPPVLVPEHCPVGRRSLCRFGGHFGDMVFLSLFRPLGPLGIHGWVAI